MKTYLDRKPVGPESLTYREMGPRASATPAHLRHPLRIEIPRAELVEALEAPFEDVLKELRDDIAKSGNGPDETERALLACRTIEEPAGSTLTDQLPANAAP